jgi:hypothetical protein
VDWGRAGVYRGRLVWHDDGTVPPHSPPWPTPRASDSAGHSMQRVVAHLEGIHDKGWQLREAVIAAALRPLWPTPSAGMHKQDVNDDGRYARWVRERGFQEMLPVAVKLRSEGVGRGFLNPDWTEWLMGYPSVWSLAVSGVEVDASEEDVNGLV